MELDLKIEEQNEFIARKGFNWNLFSRFYLYKHLSQSLGFWGSCSTKGQNEWIGGSGMSRGVCGSWGPWSPSLVCWDGNNAYSGGLNNRMKIDFGFSAERGGGRLDRHRMKPKPQVCLLLISTPRTEENTWVGAMIFPGIKEKRDSGPCNSLKPKL